MSDAVFIKRGAVAAPEYSGLPLLHLVGVAPKSGEIGIEIEVEGNKFPKNASNEWNAGDYKKIPKTWKYDKDGSLRGEDNAEYVLAKPIKFDEVPKAISDLWAMFADYGSVLTESNRTSVHVHLNVQQFHLNRLCSFVAMYFVVEDLLTSWCGDHRVGNLFCLRAKDAPAIVRRFKEFIQKDGYGYQFSSGMHYAGLNPSAIHKFGSIEIRSLRGVNDPQIILDWVSVLQRLYELSAEFKDPREVVAGFSGSGPIAWLQNLLGDKFSTIMDHVPYNTDEVRDILYEGIRLAQDLCYCRDWSEFKEKEFKGDPFSRKIKISSQLVSPSSIGSTYFVSGETSPSTSSGYTNSFILNHLGHLRNTGQLSDITYQSLLAMNTNGAQNWLISQGLLAPYGTEPEDEVDSDDDYEPDFDHDEYTDHEI